MNKPGPIPTLPPIKPIPPGLLGRGGGGKLKVTREQWERCDPSGRGADKVNCIAKL